MEQLVNDFSWGLFFWQLGVLIVLLILLRKFAWKPILNSLNDREQGIKNALESAENARVEMQNLKANNDKLLQEARQDRDEMLKEARDMKDKMIQDASDEANEKAEKIIERAQNSIEGEKRAAIAEIKGQMADLSVDIAEKVVRKELDDKKDQQKLVERLLEETKLN